MGLVFCGSLNTSGEMEVVVAVCLVFGGVWILFRGPLTTTSPAGIKLRLVSLGNWVTGKASVGELTLVSVGNSLTEKVFDVSKGVSKEGFWVAATWYILHRHVSIEVSLPSNNNNWFSILDREMVMLFIIVEISVEFLDPTFLKKKERNQQKERVRGEWHVKNLLLHDCVNSTAIWNKYYRISSQFWSFSTK